MTSTRGRGGDFAWRLTTGCYFLALGAWVGAIVMLAVAAAIIFATVRAYEPMLHAAPYDAPQLVERAPAILAGGIVGSVLQGLAVIQTLCAVVVVIAVLLQCTLFAARLPERVTGLANLVRIGLIIIPLALLAADRFWITPVIWAERATMYDAQAPPDVAQAAQARFDRFHKASERLVSIAVFCLAGAMLLSPWALLAAQPARAAGDGQASPDSPSAYPLKEP